MTNDAASLDRLHDLLVPAPVPWWPPAPGWYFILTIVLVLALGLALWALRRRLRNAYRREALAALNAGPASAIEIATLLKRAALTAYPRAQVAGLSGKAWLDWLVQTSGLAVQPEVAEMLTSGVYSTAGSQNTRPLAEFAARWIQRHQNQNRKSNPPPP